MQIETLLASCLEQGASDLHLSAGEPPRMRIHGTLAAVSDQRLTPEAIQEMLKGILNDFSRKQFENELEADFALELDCGRFRVNLFTHSRGLGGVFRQIPSRIPSLKDLKTPRIFSDLCERERGLILVTGPTGSGKSTTLAAMIDHINETRDAHILTIEDPIEFVHQPKRALINHREVGPHTHAFANALRSALREDPDVILVGEMRDLETIALALTAAETGHLVLGTLHSSSAAQTIDRIIDVFPPAQQNQIRIMLAESLVAVIAQTLVPTTDGQGRVAAHEIMVALASVRNLVREGKTSQIVNALQTGARHGMQTLDRALENLVRGGQITPAAARTKAHDPESLHL